MSKPSNRIVNILMKRDGVTREEAEYMVESCVQAMEEVNFDPFESEEILYGHLGLELDYIYDLLHI